MRDVLVAARDLNVEEVVKPEAVKVVKMAKSSVPVDGFAAAPDVEGRWLMIKTLEGEPILNRKLAPKGNPAGLVSRIPKGMRAYAIEINEQTGVSGFVHARSPGRRDPVEDGRQGQRRRCGDDPPGRARPGVGADHHAPEDKSIMARTVTLAVTPEMVDTLVSARSQGPVVALPAGAERPRQDGEAGRPAPRRQAPSSEAGAQLLGELAVAIKKVPLDAAAPARRTWTRGSPRGCGPVAIEVKEHTGVAGFVLPENQVDVIQLRDGKAGGAETVLQDVLVCRRARPSRDRQPLDPMPDSDAGVTPEQGNPWSRRMHAAP
jgi:Flp pilus assembly protein CpaB